jgi:hypothetical protein
MSILEWINLKTKVTWCYSESHGTKISAFSQVRGHYAYRRGCCHSGGLLIGTLIAHDNRSDVELIHSITDAASQACTFSHLWFLRHYSPNWGCHLSKIFKRYSLQEWTLQSSWKIVEKVSPHCSIWCATLVEVRDSCAPGDDLRPPRTTWRLTSLSPG